MLKTPLCDLLGIEKPVFQGGMAWIADASLASAVRGRRVGNHRGHECRLQLAARSDSRAAHQDG